MCCAELLRFESFVIAAEGQARYYSWHFDVASTSPSEEPRHHLANCTEVAPEMLSDIGHMGFLELD